jgi:hypothetical protein
MRILIALIAALALAAAGAEGMPYSHFMVQMEGSCGDFTADVHSELKLMSGQLTSITAGSGVADAAQIQPGVAYSVRLLPQEQVHFAVPPAQNRGGEGRSAGVVTLRDLPAGNWRISTDNPVWLDLIVAGQLLNSSSFEMKSGCSTILKTVVYAVPGKSPVVIQVNGATQPSVRILVTPVVGPPK